MSEADRLELIFQAGLSTAIPSHRNGSNSPSTFATSLALTERKRRNESLWR